MLRPQKVKNDEIVKGNRQFAGFPGIELEGICRGVCYDPASKTNAYIGILQRQTGELLPFRGIGNLETTMAKASSETGLAVTAQCVYDFVKGTMKILGLKLGDVKSSTYLE